MMKIFSLTKMNKGWNEIVKEKVGIKEIAKISGYSISTVSRVLNGTGKCSREAADVIKGVAAECGYKEMMQGNGLEMKCIALLLPDISIDFYALFAKQIQSELLLQGYYPILIDLSHSRVSLEESIRMLRALNVKVAINICNHMADEDIVKIGLPMVFVNRNFKSNSGLLSKQRFVSICSDNEESGVIAAEEFYRSGCRKVTYLSALPMEGWAVSVRRDAFFRRAQELGMSCIPCEPYLNPLTEAQGAFRAIRSFWDKGNSVDGIFCATDWAAVGALLHMREASIRVPEEVQVIGAGAVSDYPNFFQILTTIKVPVYEMAKEVSNAAISMTNDDTYVPKDICFPVSLQKGNTTIR